MSNSEVQQTHLASHTRYQSSISIYHLNQSKTDTRCQDYISLLYQFYYYVFSFAKIKSKMLDFAVYAV